MVLNSSFALALIIIALIAVASVPMAGAEDSGFAIVKPDPPKPCPKFTIAHIMTLAKMIKDEDPDGVMPPPATNFIVMKEFEMFSLEQIKVARDFVIRSKGVATSGAEECEIDDSTGMCTDKRGAASAVPSFSACNMWSEAKGRAFVDEAKEKGFEALWVAETHLPNLPYGEIVRHWDVAAV
eukprot:CAMPEP_0118641612 /NCGR_PEP_ID=MMETSP0785-20121206/5388_1 /TAXON_ID=91992 /ORGANISM="Bolidomonas pacifica, Strain CCMP 1866" /LENGTH=181 /DNA_ID=CAMNT_0006533095 /DNA_START=103 /DNA_END=648 /DNA_ORIENTATION=+